jgi:RHS repeat-associated protein
VISNKRHQSAGNTFEADVVSAQDYYAFGSHQPGRSYTAANSSYRYGFNGQEKSLEIDENHTTFRFREFNSLTGKFWSTDPIEKDYPWNSPYAFAENRVIDGGDLEGLEYENRTNNNSQGGTYGPLNEATANQTGATLSSGFKTESQQAADRTQQTLNTFGKNYNSFQATIKNRPLVDQRPDFQMSYQIGTGIADGLASEGIGLGIGAALKGGQLAYNAVKTFEGLPRIGFTRGMSVFKYVPEGASPSMINSRGLSFSTNLSTKSSLEVYNSLGLGFRTRSGAINKMSNSYTVYSSSMRGFYLTGKTGAQGITKGGATQFVGFRGLTSFTKPSPLYNTITP